jgi:hypothetical protein
MMEGFYFDPWHGGCMRRIAKARENQFKIYGVYGNDENRRLPKDVEYHPEGSDMTNKYWYATCRVQNNHDNLYHLKVYFGGKRGKKRLHYDAVYDEKKRQIKWDDTNVWKQMYHHPKQLF